MADNESGFSPEDEHTLDLTDQALEQTPEAPELEALHDKSAAHLASLNNRLRELTYEEARDYAYLRNAVGHLLFALAQKPQITALTEPAIARVTERLGKIDPYWNTHGLSPEDYARYRDLDTEHTWRVIDRLGELEAKEQSDG